MKKGLLTGCAALACTLAIGLISPSIAQAKVTGVLVKDANGKLYKYDYAKLKLALFYNGKDAAKAALYTDFAAKGTTVAYYDDAKNSYVDLSDIKLAFFKAKQAGSTFDMNNYTATSAAKVLPVTTSVTTQEADDKGNVTGKEDSSDPVVKHTTYVGDSMEVGKKKMITVELTDTADDGKYDILYNGTKLSKLAVGVYSIDVDDIVDQATAEARIKFVKIGDSQDESFDVESIY